MNLVAYGEERYYLASVKKENDKFFVRTVVISEKEVILHGPFLIPCSDEWEAKKRCRGLVGTKIKKRGYVRIEMDKIPDFVAGFLVVDLDKQLTPQEILEYVRKVRNERYVVLADNAGFEDLFDLGVQYVAYNMEDPDTIEVCDKFGTLRGIYRKRIATIEKTENAILIEKKF